MTEQEVKSGLESIMRTCSALLRQLSNGLFEVKESKFSLDKCIDEGIMQGYTEQQSIDFYHHYNRKGWMIGNVPVTNLSSAMIHWRRNGYADKTGTQVEKKEDKSVCYWCGKNSDGEKRLTPFDMYKAEDHAFCGKWHYDLWVRKGRPEK